MRDQNYEQTLRSLNGEGSALVPFPSVHVEGKASMAAKMCATSFRESHNISLRVGHKRQLDLDTLALSSRGLKYYAPLKAIEDELAKRDLKSSRRRDLEKEAEAAKELIGKRCLNEFVTEIDYGAFFTATMAIEYKNADDKLDLGGSLKVDIVEGTVKVEGALQAARDKVKRSVRVSIEAYQDGGTPELLATVFTPELATCDGINIENCVKVFMDLVAYGKTIPQQLQGIDDYVPLTYHTGSYEEHGIEELVTERQPISRKTREVRAGLERKLGKVRQQEARTATLLRVSHQLSHLHVLRLHEIEEDLFNNKMILKGALETCYEFPYTEQDEAGEDINPCLLARDQALAVLKPIDEYDLAVPSEQGLLLEP